AEGGLPRPQGQRELRTPADGPGGGGRAPAVRAAVLQRRRARPQRHRAAGPRRAGCTRLRLPRSGVLPGRCRQPRGARRGAVTVNRLAAVASTWLLAASVLLAPAPAAADERVLAYDSVVEIQADGSLDVTEHIRVRAEGTRIRRGITRDFPVRYRDHRGNNVVVAFEVERVERDGRPEPWFTERVANGVRVNTGNDDLLQVPAEYTYTLRYRTDRQLGFFEDHDELYWNAIGLGWDFPIENGTVELRLPEPVAMADLAVEGYSGARGARGQDFEAVIAAPGVARWTLTRPLAPGEGLTTVLSFPKGIVAPPSSTRDAFWLLRDNL